MSSTDSSHDVGAEQCLERFGKRSTNSVLVYVEDLEQRLVEQPAGSVVCLHVGTVAVAGKVKGGLEVGLHGVEMGAGSTQARFDEFQLPGDPVLLGLEQFQRNGSGVMGLQQPGPFVGQLLALVAQGSVQSFSLSAGGLEFLGQSGFDALT